MPNWCTTEYKCVGDLKEVKALHKVLKYIEKRKTSIVTNDFGRWWLGNLVTKLGGKWQDYPCRGKILSYSLDGDVLLITQMTAWCEQEGVRRLIQEKFPGIKVYYRVEEPGCEVFYTNDNTGCYFPEIYFLTSNEEDLYFKTIEEAAERVSEIVGYNVEATVAAIDEALKKYMELQNESSEDYVYYGLYEFKVVDN